MKYNFHTHTYHCHHASGTPEEYVLRAIEGGVTEMGFSDHFPFDFENGVCYYGDSEGNLYTIEF